MIKNRAGEQRKSHAVRCPNEMGNDELEKLFVSACMIRYDVYKYTDGGTVWHQGVCALAAQRIWSMD